jgi:hypothetical protein
MRITLCCRYRCLPDKTALALFAFIGGLSAATGMVIVETIAVSTMVCNELVDAFVAAHAATFSRGAGHDLTLDAAQTFAGERYPGRADFGLCLLSLGR